MPVPEAIPTTHVIVASALLTGFIAYQSRKNGLETKWEREQFINSRLSGGTFPSDMWGLTCDHVMIIEDTGWRYRFKKFFTGRMSGEAVVSVRYENVSIPGSVWENSNLQAALDALGFEWEHVGTNQHLQPTHARFVLQTVERSEIMDFFNAIIEAEKWGRKQMAKQ